MELLDGPAVLGSIIMFATLAAWAFGRVQGGLAVPEETAAPVGERSLARPAEAAPPAGSAAASTPCQHAARNERSVALAAAPALGDMHEEIAAYRRAQQVFAGMDEDGLRLVPVQHAGPRNCRFIGLTGEPTCGLSAPVRGACAPGTPCAADAAPARPERAVQPSLARSDWTRV